MTDRRIFPRAVKRAAYKRAGGRCQSCGFVFPAGGGGIEYHHIDPWTLSHDSSLENCLVLCIPCHKATTSSVNRPDIDKNRRLRDRGMGIKRAGKKLPGGRDSNWSKTIRGEVIPRVKERGAKDRAVVARRQIGVFE